MDGCLGAIMEEVVLPEPKQLNYQDTEDWDLSRRNGRNDSHMITPILPEMALEMLNKFKGMSYKMWEMADVKVEEYLTEDAEYIVEGIIEGTATYNEGGAKEYPVVAALTITHKGNQVKVGSGLSKEQRIGWLQNPEEIIGKTITVQYFEETQDSKTGEYSLRFPVLKYVYENGRDI